MLQTATFFCRRHIPLQLHRNTLHRIIDFFGWAFDANSRDVRPQFTNVLAIVCDRSVLKFSFLALDHTDLEVLIRSLTGQSSATFSPRVGRPSISKATDLRSLSRTSFTLKIIFDHQIGYTTFLLR